MKKTTKTALIATAFALAAAGAAGAYAVYEYNHQEPAVQDVQTHYGAPLGDVYSSELAKNLYMRNN